MIGQEEEVITHSLLIAKTFYIANGHDDGWFTVVEFQREVGWTDPSAAEMSKTTRSLSNFTRAGWLEQKDARIGSTVLGPLKYRITPRGLAWLEAHSPSVTDQSPPDWGPDHPRAFEVTLTRTVLARTAAEAAKLFSSWVQPNAREILEVTVADTVTRRITPNLSLAQPPAPE